MRRGFYAEIRSLSSSRALLARDLSLPTFDPPQELSSHQQTLGRPLNKVQLVGFDTAWLLHSETRPSDSLLEEKFPPFVVGPSTSL